jgi:GntR family transcriptional regulator
MSLTDLKFKIDPNIKTPMWLQIRNELFDCLYKDILRPGQLIPNEKTLVGLFNVSIGTVRKAIGALEKEGILIRKQGLGTFVCQHDDRSFLFKFFHIFFNDSDVRHIPEVELASFKKEKANKTEMKLLNIPKENDKVFHIYNKLGFQGKVHSVDKIVIAAAKFSLLTEEILVNRHNTIYNLFQNKFNVFITHTSERIKATLVDKKISQMLGIEMGTPILKIERLGYTYHDEIVELRTSYVNTTEVEYIREQYSLVGE